VIPELVAPGLGVEGAGLSSSDPLGLALLAVVQGLTEFLPVSSSGHLVLAQHVLGFSEPALAVDVALHVGTLLAVLAVYGGDLVALLVGALRGVAGARRGLALLAVGSLPAAVVGIGLADVLEHVFERPRLAAFGLLVTSAWLCVGVLARRRAAPGEPSARSDAAPDWSTLGWGGAVAMGCAQAVAIWPGVSRSGATIATGLALRVPAAEAARFSFLLSVPAIGGAALLSLPDALAADEVAAPGLVALAALLAGVVGWGALRLLLAFLGRGAFAWCAVYTALLGVAALVLLPG